LKTFRQKYSFPNVGAFIKRLRPLRVVVIGETIIDRYDYVEPLGVSPKGGGVVTVKYLSTDYFAGGSLACANHMANFCSSVSLVSAIGSRNSFSKFISDSLQGNIETFFLRRRGLPTILKKREFDPFHSRKYSETYLFDEIPLSYKEEDGLIKLLNLAGIEKTDLVFVADYGHGLMTERLIRFIENFAPLLSLNVQTNSTNYGMNLITTKYNRANFICLDQLEARLSFGDRFSPLSDLALRLKNKFGAHFVAVTKAHDGSLVLGKKDAFDVPVLRNDYKVVENTGAGDAYYSLAALCASLGIPTAICGFLGSAMGTIATTYVGNKKSITPEMLYSFIKPLFEN
jgi:bifunctional ADP-heptose synthase (sugar kinase/adenylyltransferase)